MAYPPLTEIAPHSLKEQFVCHWLIFSERSYERATIDGAETAAKTLSLVHKNDLIINKIWVRHGSTAIASSSVHGCAASGEFPTFVLDEQRIEARWLHWLSKTPGFWDKCDKLSQGTSGKNRIKPERFLTIEIPLPLPAEQRRILARIEALAGRIDEAMAIHQRAKDETDSVLMAVLTDIEFGLKGVGSDATVADVIESNDSGWSPQCEGGPAQPGEWGVLKTTSVQWLRFVPVQNKAIRPGQVPRPEIEVGVGDVLITRAGPVNRVGIACCVNESVARLMLSDKIVRVKANGSVLPQFLAITLSTPQTQEYFRHGKTGLADSQVNIPRSKLLAAPIRILPISKQRGIIGHVTALQAKIDSLQSLQTETAAELDALLPSLLNQAFEGKL